MNDEIAHRYGAGREARRDARRAVASAARRLAEERLLIGTAGNVSLLVAPELIAVTATGVVLHGCRPEDVSFVDLAGKVIEGSLRPTSELDLHLAVYDADPAAGAVVHTHAPYSTAAACVLDELPLMHYEQLLLGGTVRVAPYATFGTQELALAVRDALDGRSAALMANHGSVAHGSTLGEAIERALLLEWLCQLHHRAAALGTPRVLSEDQIAAVIEAAVRRNYGRPQENP